MNLDELNTNYAPAQEAIALLIDMAKRGEINPWDVQVIDVIDRCLSKLADSHDSDLAQSGQAFLYASMLVLLKADTLLNQSAQEENSDLALGEGDEFLDQGDEAQARLPLNLEKHIRRRPTAAPPQRRPVTLQDLIKQLQEMAVTLQEQAPRPKIKRPLRQSQSQAARAIAELAHQENLTEMASQLDQFLNDYYAQKSDSHDWLVFDELVQLWESASPSSHLQHPPQQDSSEHQSNDRVAIFWALLLLSAQSKVELAQEEFYQDIKIRSLITPAHEQIPET